MTKFPNQEGLNRALNEYRVVMCEFVFEYLQKKVQSETVEELIERALGREPRDIDIKDISKIFNNRECWNLFSRKFSYDSRLGRNYDIRSRTRMMVIARNEAAHVGSVDLDPEFTQAYLFLITDVLKEIGKLDAMHEVEDIRDELFSDDLERQPAQVNQIAAYKKRLTTVSNQLAVTASEKAAVEEHLADISSRLETVEVEKTELEKRLRTTSDRLKDVEKENVASKKHIETIPGQLEAANTEKAKYEKALKAALNQLVTLKAANAKLEERLETTSIQLENVEAELTVCKKRLSQTLDPLADAEAEEPGHEEDFAEIDEHLPPNSTSPDSITFQGTTFTRHLNKYHVTEDDISQNFWHYWHSQGRDGKQEMRDAGWSVEKVNGDWEVTISPEDFEAWIAEDDEPLAQPIRLSNKRVVLPTGKAMEQPVLEFLSDSEPKSTAAEKFRAANTLEDRKEIGRQVAELRINSAGSKPMSWKKIREKLGLKNDEFHKGIRLEDHFRESVVERIESFEEGWVYGGKLEVLLGFKPVGELANRIEACKPKPAPKEEVKRSPRSQRKWRKSGTVAALKIEKILNPSEKARLERELREAKRAVDGSTI